MAGMNATIAGGGAEEDIGEVVIASADADAALVAVLGHLESLCRRVARGHRPAAGCVRELVQHLGHLGVVCRQAAFEGPLLALASKAHGAVLVAHFHRIGSTCVEREERIRLAHAASLRRQDHGHDHELCGEQPAEDGWCGFQVHAASSGRLALASSSQPARRLRTACRRCRAMTKTTPTPTNASR